MVSQKRGRAASPRRGGSEGGADAAPDKSAPATRAPGAGGESEPSASEGSVQASTGAAAAAREPLGPPATAALPPLPDALALLIFALLPVRKRLYCRRVSRAWRRALELPALWRSVDLRNTQGWPDARRARVLGLASRLAAGQMQTLCVEFHHNTLRRLQDHAGLVAALVEIAAASAATLLTLDVSYGQLDIDVLTQLAERCRALRTFRVRKLKCSLQNDAEAQRLLAVLSGDGCYKAVAVEALTIEHVEQLPNAAALSASMERHRSLRCLHVCNFRSSAAAMAYGLAAARAGAVEFLFGDMEDEEELARQAALLLNGFPVQRLVLRYNSGFRDRMCAPFTTAVRSHRSLSYLGLEYMAIGEESVEVLRALVGHPTLQSVSLYGSATNWRGTGIRLHEALAELMAAPSALTYLCLGCMYLDDSNGLAVSLAGLASPHARLEYLDLTMNQEITPRFAARVIGPAVLRCATLKELELDESEHGVLHAAHLHINKLLQIKNEEEEDAASSG
jgi:hypothetical protein